MKSIVIEDYGDVNELKLVEGPTPRAKGNEVLVEVHAVSVNPFEWKVRAGYFKDFMPFTFPIVLGSDVSGVVKEVGEQVTDFQVGDEVFASADLFKPGSYADFILIEDRLLARKPHNVSFEEAAAIPVAGLTPWQSLADHAKLKEGETVLIHGGAGGVGIFAIQFAKHFGATVATTTSGKNVEFVRGLGADIVINYEEQHFGDQLAKFDVVLDTIGGDVLAKSYDVLKPGGRLVTIAGQSDEELAREKGITASMVMMATNVEQLATIANLVSEGKVKVVISERFPFTEEGVRKAHLLSQTGHVKGKIILKMK